MYGGDMVNSIAKSHNSFYILFSLFVYLHIVYFDTYPITSFHS